MKQKRNNRATTKRQQSNNKPTTKQQQIDNEATTNLTTNRQQRNNIAKQI